MADGFAALASASQVMQLIFRQRSLVPIGPQENIQDPPFTTKVERKKLVSKHVIWLSQLGPAKFAAPF